MRDTPDLQTQMKDDAFRLEFWATLALRHTRGLGAHSWALLLRSFGSAYAAVQAWERWSACGVPERRAKEFASERWRKPALQEWGRAIQLNAPVLLWQDARYPDLLREIATAPPLLYFRGNVRLLATPCLAVVGSRHPSQEGIYGASRLAHDLSACGLTVVSGMAQGIDRIAHQAALRQIGSSVAVLGTGLDVVYPAHNRDIMEALAAQGCVVTEFAPGTRPRPEHFPVRNRIISGLSLGVLLIEAALRSGSLGTARHALDQAREVYAIPGSVDAVLSAGCQHLIREGAQPVFSVEDILSDLAPQLLRYGIGATQLSRRLRQIDTADRKIDMADRKNVGHVARKTRASGTFAAPAVTVAAAAQGQSASAHGAITDMLSRPEVQRILAWLEKTGRSSPEQICEGVGLSPGTLAGLLIALEMAGQLQRSPGGFYARRRT